MTEHRAVGLHYAVTSIFFLGAGFLLMILLRWQLAYPGQPLPAWLAAALGDANAPGGIMLPEFYNQLVAMHGTVMIFLAVVPLAAGAFGTLLVPGLIGAPGMALPRTSALAFWLYAAGGVAMIASFFVEGGAANSGWTSYPPLAVLATTGQTLWLFGILLVGVSSGLGAIVMITTIVCMRAPGMTFGRLPFFVWAQLVTALLLLLAFPALKAAAVFQLMDRLAGTSFFMPTGLLIGGIPLEGYSGGGNPLLWQHLFWFLAHPEVYVLVLPAMGIVAEVIVANTGRPLWGYGLMVAAVLFLGGMSMVVWAHHMFLTGMGTTMSAFFQITTFIVSLPSIVIVTALVLSLWGGAIRFPTAMLFALAFLPMFGIGGLTGLPLGLAASDIALHDTFYVVGHFHYLVAPGTLFAIFAGVYHWFPAVMRGRRLDERLGRIHFWTTLFLMNNVFLPMFVVGLAGVNRRLYDAGLQFALAENTFGLQRHMTWSAIALGVAQIPFLVNIGRALATDATPIALPAAAPLRSGGVDTAPAHPSVAVVASWLLIASLTMFLGSLMSGYILIRTGSAAWPALVELAPCLAGLVLLLAASRATRLGGRWTVGGAFLGAMFVSGWVVSVSLYAASGLSPASSVPLASWLTVSGAVTAIVAGVSIGTLKTAFGATPVQAVRLPRLERAWVFASIAWLVVVCGFSLV